MPSRLSSLATRILLLISLASSTRAQEYLTNGPCGALCSQQTVGTQANDVVCLDGNFTSIDGGNNFRKCVTCQLNSTAVDTAANTTDVEWALFKLRYTLSECMFGLPQEVVSISSPCQVSCQPLSNAISLNLSNNTTGASPDLSYCQDPNFVDVTINNCAFCYGFIPQQLFLANFLQALHTACLNPPVPGTVFFPDGPTIFNESLIPGPTRQTASSGSSSRLHGGYLALVIVLPVIAIVLLLLASCFALYVITRRRRERQMHEGRMKRVTQQVNSGHKSYSPIVPVPGQRWTTAAEQPMQEMEAMPPSHVPEQGHGERWSGRLQEDHSPAKNSFIATEVVGPAEDQVQDHALHDLYFGVSSPEEEEAEMQRRAHFGVKPGEEDGEEEEPVGAAGPSTTPGTRHQGVNERGAWI